MVDAGLAAVLGARILPEEVVGVLDQPVAYAIGELDPGAALFRLVRAGLLEIRAGIGFRFPSASLRRAVERTLPAGVRRQHHDAVLRWLLGSARRDEATLHRIVRHATATGLTEEAYSAHLLLAEAAQGSGRPRAAVAQFGAALALLGPGDPRRAPVETAIRELLAAPIP